MYGLYNDDSALIARFVAPVSVRSNETYFISDSLNKRRNVAKLSGQRWEVTAKLEPLTVNANGLFALFMQKGLHSTYNINIPQNYGAIFSRVVGTTTVKGWGTGKASSVTITASNSKIPAGTFIKFANHEKIYVTLNELNGLGTLNIKPELRVGVPSGTVIHWQEDVFMASYLDISDACGMTFIDGIMMDNGELKFVEANV